MDPISNPYRPGAGTKPLILAGRAKVIEKAVILLARVKDGKPQRSLMLYGLRGVGKTVLLNEFEQLARLQKYIVEHIEVSESDDFHSIIARTFRRILLRIDSVENVKSQAFKALRVLKAFTVTLPDGPELRLNVDALMGEADSGNFEKDLTDIVVNVGETSRQEEKPICILIDEAQYLKESDFAALIAASHRISQLGLPLLFICAGLPHIAALSGEAKSYAERLFEFIPVQNLDDEEARLAITEPASTLSVEYEPEAVSELVKITEGYPYFIQEFGKTVWDFAKQSPITKSDVSVAKAKTLSVLDKSFFKVRLDRATSSEKDLMKHMAMLGKGPYKMGDVSQKMDRKIESLGPIRATLIGKGFVFSPEYGIIDFTVPQFDAFLRRFFQLGT